MAQWTPHQRQALMDLQMTYDAHLHIDGPEANGVHLDGFFSLGDLQALVHILSTPDGVPSETPIVRTQYVYATCSHCAQPIATLSCSNDGALCVTLTMCPSCGADMRAVAWRSPSTDSPTNHPLQTHPQ